MLLAHERIIEHISGHEGVRPVTFDEIADDFVRRNPRRSGGEPGQGAGSRTP